MMPANNGRDGELRLSKIWLARHSRHKKGPRSWDRLQNGYGGGETFMPRVLPHTGPSRLTFLVVRVIKAKHLHLEPV
jgi:hypothetical protein